MVSSWFRCDSVMVRRILLQINPPSQDISSSGSQRAGTVGGSVRTCLLAISPVVIPPGDGCIGRINWASLADRWGPLGVGLLMVSARVRIEFVLISGRFLEWIDDGLGMVWVGRQ